MAAFGLPIEEYDGDNPEHGDPNFSWSESPHHPRVIPSTPAIKSIPLKLKADVCAKKGKRITMEDAHCIETNLVIPGFEDVIGFFGVFDGHGGNAVAVHAAKQVCSVVAQQLERTKDPVVSLVEGLKLVDEETRDLRGGATALCALVVGDNCYVANLGDSRAVLYDTNHPGNVVPLSRDHKPYLADEEKRITKAGGKVTYYTLPGSSDRVYRVNSILSVSRSLGDYSFKPPSMTDCVVGNEAEVCQVTLTDTSQCLILACDGLWDKVSNEEAVQIVAKEMITDPKETFLKRAASALVECSLERRSLDNVTAMVISFH